MVAQLPYIAPNGDRLCDRFLCGVRVEVIILRFRGYIQLFDDVFQFVLLKAGDGEVVAFKVKVDQEGL